jgi:hypothetical protein
MVILPSLPDVLEPMNFDASSVVVTPAVTNCFVALSGKRRFKDSGGFLIATRHF